MRRLCLFSGGLALAAALYVYAVHAAPWPLLLGLAVLCGGLFLLRKAGTRRAAVCVLGLLTGFAWYRGYEALFLRPLALCRARAAVCGRSPRRTAADDLRPVLRGAAEARRTELHGSFVL